MINPFVEARIAAHEHNTLVELQRYRSLYCAALQEIVFIFNQRDAEFLRERDECGDPGELETHYDEFMLSLRRKETANMLLPRVRDEFKPLVRYLANREVEKLPLVVVTKKEVKELARRSA